MRAVLQRVSRAQVAIEGEVVGQIGPGLMILLGVTLSDTEAQAQYLADKAAKLRLFPSEKGEFDLDVAEISGGVLAVSQFTLHAETKKGRRPSFSKAARPEVAEPLYEAKLVLVGEGGVGKTTLLKALMDREGAAPREGEPTTHGVQIDIQALHLPHPDKEGVEIQLNAWDFGGQEIYHATHQFFLTNRSLFLLAWNARHGYEQGKLYYWLDAIQARAPESPVILVATHLDQRDADLPLVLDG